MCISRARAPLTRSYQMQRLTGSQIARQLQRPARPLFWRCAASPGELFRMYTKELGRIDGISHRITGDRTGAAAKVAGRSSTS
jgi:hypothetical protein